MRFQIVTAIPHFDSYDSIRGWSYRREPYAYQTLDLARKLAAIRNRMGDEVHAEVVAYDAIVNVSGPKMWPDADLPVGDDDLPF